MSIFLREPGMQLWIMSPNFKLDGFKRRDNAFFALPILFHERDFARVLLPVCREAKPPSGVNSAAFGV